MSEELMGVCGRCSQSVGIYPAGFDEQDRQKREVNPLGADLYFVEEHFMKKGDRYYCGGSGEHPVRVFEPAGEPDAPALAPINMGGLHP